MNIDMETRKKILIRDIERIKKDVSDISMIKRPWDYYDKFGQICTLFQLILKHPLCRLFLNELHEMTPKIYPIKDYRRVRESETWYSFYELYILNKAWELNSETKNTDINFHFYDDDLIKIKDYSVMLEDLKADDSSSSFVTGNGEDWECIFDHDDFIKWVNQLCDYLIPRIESVNDISNETNEIKEFPNDICFDKKNNLINYKDISVDLTEKQSSMFDIFKKNFGNPIDYKTFENNSFDRRSVTNTVSSIRRKLEKFKIPLIIDSSGKGYFLNKKDI
ncbi:MAG: helix-turn-helix domain-containing protein [Candidatus Shapirobacteria bacterium]